MSPGGEINFGLDVINISGAGVKRRPGSKEGKKKVGSGGGGASRLKQAQGAYGSGGGDMGKSIRPKWRARG